MIFAKTDQIVIANGELQPTTRVRSIKLPISGVVEEVYVKEGNLVEKDEKLLKINDDLNIETKQNLINKIFFKEEELKLKKPLSGPDVLWSSKSHRKVREKKSAWTPWPKISRQDSILQGIYQRLQKNAQHEG